METCGVEVAPGVELALDSWRPSALGQGEGQAGGEALPPFLLVHGLASNARLWDGVAERLAAVGPAGTAGDRRGHGRSSKPDEGYDVPTVAADVAALIRRSGLDRPIVAGQSWGGNVVLELAASAPACIGGIACVDGGWLEPRARLIDWEACLAVLAPPRLAGRPYAEVEARIRAGHPEWSESGIRGTLGNFERRADGTIAPWLTYERHLSVLRGMWDYCPSERYTAVGVPALLVPVESGMAERDAEKRTAVEAAAAAIPKAAVAWFRGDHDIHAQRPSEVASLLHESCRTLFA
jgi:pimeloyl-ACP methyl ester carboxylesterase